MSSTFRQNLEELSISLEIERGTQSNSLEKSCLIQPIPLLGAAVPVVKQTK